MIYFVYHEPNNLNLTGEFYISILSYIPYSISLHILAILLKSIQIKNLTN